MKLMALVQTCDACPSQWEGLTDDNRVVYIRYRWGELTVQLSEPCLDIHDAISHEPIYDEVLGNSFDGIMSTKEMLATTKHLWEEICLNK